MFCFHYDTGSDAGTGTINTIMNPARQASYHSTIGTATGVTEHVRIEDTAWANGTSTDRNHRLWIGHARHPIVRERNVNPNLYTISICIPGDRAPIGETRIEQAVELILHYRREVHRIWGVWIKLDRTHIIGHDEISRTLCPGLDFPFEEIINRARARAGASARAAGRPAGGQSPREGVLVRIGDVETIVPAQMRGDRWVMTLPDGPEGQPQPSVLLRVVLETMGFDVGWDSADGAIVAALPVE